MRTPDKPALRRMHMVFKRGLKFPGSQLESLLSVLTKLNIVDSGQTIVDMYPSCIASYHIRSEGEDIWFSNVKLYMKALLRSLTHLHYLREFFIIDIPRPFFCLSVLQYCNTPLLFPTPVNAIVIEDVYLNPFSGCALALLQSPSNKRPIFEIGMSTLQ